MSTIPYERYLDCAYIRGENPEVWSMNPGLTMFQTYLDYAGDREYYSGE